MATASSRRWACGGPPARPSRSRSAPRPCSARVSPANARTVSARLRPRFAPAPAPTACSADPVRRRNSRWPAATASMDRVQAAFGLSLRSPFRLPGPILSGVGGPSLPVCTLELASETALRAEWSGPASPTSWKGSLKDGSELAIEWGTGGDLLLRYGPQALFRLDSEATRLACAPRDFASISWRRILCSRVLPLVALAHGREALHAAAVETPAGVVAIVGPSGAGKSTLAAELVMRGHRVFTDDVLVLSSAGGKVLAHPGGPYLSVANGAMAPPGETLDIIGDKRWIVVEEAAREARRGGAGGLAR